MVHRETSQLAGGLQLTTQWVVQELTKAPTAFNISLFSHY
jgi:hypothetical protein